jgi:hypothetical protein
VTTPEDQRKLATRRSVHSPSTTRESLYQRPSYTSPFSPLPRCWDETDVKTNHALAHLGAPKGVVNHHDITTDLRHDRHFAPDGDARQVQGSPQLQTHTGVYPPILNPRGVRVANASIECDPIDYRDCYAQGPHHTCAQECGGGEILVYRDSSNGGVCGSLLSKSSINLRRAAMLGMHPLKTSLSL